MEIAQDAERDVVRRADDDGRRFRADRRGAVVRREEVKARLDEVDARAVRLQERRLEALPALDADGPVRARHARKDGTAVSHLPQVRAHRAPCREVVDLEARHLRAPLPRAEDGDRGVLREPHVRVRDGDAVDENAIDALLAEALDRFGFLPRVKLADEQDALIAGRLGDAAHARQQLADGDGVHARQHDTEELARLRLEALGEEVRAEARRRDGAPHLLRLFCAHTAAVQIARHGAL